LHANLTLLLIHNRENVLVVVAKYQENSKRFYLTVHVKLAQ